MTVTKDKTDISEKQKVTLGEAATQYLAQLPPEKREAGTQEVYRVVKWFGQDKTLDQLPIPEIGHFAEKEVRAGGNFQARLESVRAFFTYAKKAKLSAVNLSVHLKVSQEAGKPRKGAVKYSPRQTSIRMTAGEHTDLQERLALLKEERPKVADEMRRAAADKDFRENSPLEAARDHQGHVEGKIRELEAKLAIAVIVEEKGTEKRRADMGDTVTLYDMSSQEHITYALVGPTQANPLKGKVSIASPTGKALQGHSEGDAIEVRAPIGILHYRLEKIV